MFWRDLMRLISLLVLALSIFYLSGSQTGYADPPSYIEHFGKCSATVE
jgi:hypothetical protein